jgi:hypothetical protein
MTAHAKTLYGTDVPAPVGQEADGYGMSFRRQ